jgi:hypothetical protein
MFQLQCLYNVKWIKKKAASLAIIIIIIIIIIISAFSCSNAKVIDKH